MKIMAECRTCEQRKEFDTPEEQKGWAMAHIEAEHVGVYCFLKEVA